MSITLKIIVIALSFVVTVGTGIILHKKGRPFNQLLSAFHKLIALAVVIGSILIVRSAFVAGTPSPTAWVFLGISLLLFISLFATGAALSGEREMPPVVLLLHDIATYASIPSMIVCFILML